MIQRQKEKFQEMKHKNTVSRALADANRVAKENERTKELATIARLKIEDQKQLAANRATIEKANGPNKLMALGVGLQKAMVKGKAHLANVKSRKSASFSGFGGGNNQGSNSLNLGNNSNNPWQDNEERKESPFNVKSRRFEFGLRKD